MTSNLKHFPSWTRTQIILLAIFFFVAGIASRAPFRSQILHHWDSVNFALAMEQFDVRLHQPHPPGTFVIYIALGRLLDVFFNDPNTSLVWLSVILSGLGAAAMFLLANELFGPTVGLTTGLLVLVSPLIWFHGEVALSYMLEFFWIPLIVFSIYMMKTKSWWAILVSALLIGMAGGVRPNTPVFIFPLWALGVFLHRYSLKRIFVSLIVMGVGVLIWAVPMVALSGGIQEYYEVMLWWQDQHTEESASIWGLIENVTRFAMYLFYTLGPGLILLAAAAWRKRREILISVKSDWRAQTIVAWLLPGTAYLTIIHLRQPGHTFTIQPAFILLTALALVTLVDVNVRPFRWNIWAGIAALTIFFNLWFFVAGPTYLFGSQRMLFTTPSWNAIHDYDVFVENRLTAIRANFDHQATTVLASGRNFRLPDYYLRDYQLPSLSHELDNRTLMLEPPINTLIFFDDGAIRELPVNLTSQSIELPPDEALRYIVWDDNQIIELTNASLELRER